MRLKGSASDPLWYKDAIVYETHVKTFFDSNNDGIGDFGGLKQKLDYLQDLGVTCLWLLPFYPSPLRDDGYDISNYTEVHPSYGTLDDFKGFVDEAHSRNLQVITELVVNHTSDQHPWFQAARRAPHGSPERDFYVWNDNDQKYRDARIIFTDTEKSNWAWDTEARAYYWHRFFSHQPDLNFENPAVMEELLKAMRFWLDLGVDGLRLDAVPYLVEREGTNCENLLETHQVIKTFRRELDREHSGRMLLAEANQWPIDVRPYFGDGDECHMAFHFPLMPRIFMALRLEDRHPIVEIMGQTPEIPDNCQWALFLRNHDELTLEMVTDEERDYMYLAYSADPRMRINVGIRRRLAPLVDNSRRRIELLNSLLLSFPGTPILYYGDEIGMGDNFYLGDRNGVRTPMQWSRDRNAGFSRANPQQLYLPVIIDPEYHYEAINVENQQNNPHSLLHWMRNMIALRKLFKVFGRGTLEFLQPANRKVLAYLRRYQNEQILCVANLSRFAQPVELDLKELAGLRPVEILGYTEFPEIGRDPYAVTLAPYGFYWFELHGRPLPVDFDDDAEVPTLLVEGGWEGLFEGSNQHQLETAILPRFLSSQGWIGREGFHRNPARITSTRILDWGWISNGNSPAILLIIESILSGGDVQTYSLPLAVAMGDTAEALRKSHPECVLCRVDDFRGLGILHDAVFSDAVCESLLAAIREGKEIHTQNGTLRCVPDQALEGIPTESSPIYRIAPEHRNSLIFFGSQLALKLFRRVGKDANPDYEAIDYLSRKVGYDRVPALAGAIHYERGGAISTLAMLQRQVPNQGDGWSSSLEEVGRFYEFCATSPAVPEVQDDRSSAVALPEGEIPAIARDRIGFYLDTIATLGRRTAEMHLALATPGTEPDFAPDPLTGSDLSHLSGEVIDHATTALDALRSSLATLPDEIVGGAALVLARRSWLLDRLKGAAGLETNSVRIRIHGDYHLGQVLSSQNDFVILDFEGDPTLPIDARRIKQSALKDVASMLRSFSYVAYSGLLSYTARRPEDYKRLEPWARFWERSTSAAFLKAYRERVAGANLVPADNAQFARLLEVFYLGRAFYELDNELSSRPSWVGIPLSGILAVT